MNAIAPILHFAKTRRSFPALIEGDRTVTYGELADKIRRTAAHLGELGFRRGDQIGVCLKDNIDHMVALLGVIYAGGVAVPLDWRAKATENGHFIEALALATVLAEEDARLPLECRRCLLDETWRRGVAQANVQNEASSGWDDPMVISATSGSTGAPKFTVMTHKHYHFAMCGMLQLMGLSGRHRFLSTLPLYYSGGRNSCIAHLLRGDSIVLYGSLFTADEYFDLVERRQITVGVLVPSMVRQLNAAAQSGPRMPQLAKLFCTGAPLYPEEKRTAVQRLSANFHERYGTAETLAISILSPQDFLERAESVGQPHSFAEVEVADEQGRAMPNGEIGKLRFRGPGMGAPFAVSGEEKSFRDGWFYPGEIAHLDEAGYIFLHGRNSDVIIRRGAKIYPAEVERVLLAHPGVVEAAVLGELSEDNEERVVAFVVRATSESAEMVREGALLAHCRASLTPHKVPQSIHLVPALPKNTAGKVDKKVLATLTEGAKAKR